MRKEVDVSKVAEKIVEKLRGLTNDSPYYEIEVNSKEYRELNKILRNLEETYFKEKVKAAWDLLQSIEYIRVKKDRIILDKRRAIIKGKGLIDKWFRKPLPRLLSYISTPSELPEVLPLTDRIPSIEEQYKAYEDFVKKCTEERLLEKIVDKIVDKALKETMENLIIEAYELAYEEFKKNPKDKKWSIIFHKILTLLGTAVWDPNNREFKILSLEPDPKDPNTVIGNYISEFKGFVENAKGLEISELDKVPKDLQEITYVSASDSKIATLPWPLGLARLECSCIITSNRSYSIEGLPCSLTDIERYERDEIIYKVIPNKLGEHFGSPEWAVIPPRLYIEAEERNVIQAERAIRLALDYRYQVALHGKILLNFITDKVYKGEDVYPVHIIDGSITPPDSHIRDRMPRYVSRLRMKYVNYVFEDLDRKLVAHLNNPHVRLPIISGTVKRMRIEEGATETGLEILSEYPILILTLAFIRQYPEYRNIFITYAPALASRLLHAYILTNIVDYIVNTGCFDRAKSAMIFSPLPRTLLARSQIHRRIMETYGLKELYEYFELLNYESTRDIADSLFTYIDRCFNYEREQMFKVLSDLQSFKWVDTYIAPLNVSIPAIFPRYEVLIQYRGINLWESKYDSDYNKFKQRLLGFFGKREYLDTYASREKRGNIIEPLLKISDAVSMYAPKYLCEVDERVGKLAKKIVEKLGKI